MKSLSHQNLPPLTQVQYKSTQPNSLQTKHTRARQHSSQTILAQPSPPIPTPPPAAIPTKNPHLLQLAIMQLLALFLLAVSAGALPQSHNPSPSATLAPTTTTLVNTTAQHEHEKRGGDQSIGNFDDPKCHGTHLGNKATLEEDMNHCLKFTPDHRFVDIYWSSSSNAEPWTYSDDACGGQFGQTAPMEVILGKSRRCVAVADLGGEVKSVYFPSYYNAGNWKNVKQLP